MGSFSYTCAVSGLPIEAGDPVRYFLLSENPYGERAVSSHDLWVPRTFPLRAKYNDYGSVEDVQEGPERDVWLEGFNIDLVEQGWGENSVHDLAVRKNMDFDTLLHAIVEGRVRVKRESKHEFRHLDAARKVLDGMAKTSVPPKKSVIIPKGIPTWKRIERAIVRAELPLYDDGKRGFMVNKTSYGEVRVRWRSWSQDEFGKDVEWLAKVEAVLKDKYATMISAGEGAYAHAADLTVRPKPGTEGFHGRKGLGLSKKPIAVDHAMIREDVWQALLTLKTESWTSDDGKKFHTIEDYYAYADEFITSVAAALAEESKRHQAIIDDYKQRGQEPPMDLLALSTLRTRSHGESMWKNPIAGLYAKNIIPFSVGLATHWELLGEKERLTREFVRMAAEFAFIYRVLGTTRYWWRPSYSCGPQFGEWERHQELFEALSGVTRPKAEEAAREQAEFEREMAKHAARRFPRKKASKKKEART